MVFDVSIQLLEVLVWTSGKVSIEFDPHYDDNLESMRTVSSARIVACCSLEEARTMLMTDHRKRCEIGELPRVNNKSNAIVK